MTALTTFQVLADFCQLRSKCDLLEVHVTLQVSVTQPSPRPKFVGIVSLLTTQYFASGQVFNQPVNRISPIAKHVSPVNCVTGITSLHHILLRTCVQLWYSHMLIISTASKACCNVPLPVHEDITDSLASSQRHTLMLRLMGVSSSLFEAVCSTNT